MGGLSTRNMASGHNLDVDLLDERASASAAGDNGLPSPSAKGSTADEPGSSGSDEIAFVTEHAAAVRGCGKVSPEKQAERLSFFTRLSQALKRLPPLLTYAKPGQDSQASAAATDVPIEPNMVRLRRHSISIPGEPAVPHRELCSTALQRVSVEMQHPVSPTSMVVAMNQLQRRASRNGRANMVRASDPGHMCQSDFGAEIPTLETPEGEAQHPETPSPLWLHRQGALTSLTVSEDSPVIQEDDRPLPFPSPTSTRPSHTWPAQDSSVFDEDEDEDDLTPRRRLDLSIDLDLSSEFASSPSASGRSVSRPMLRRCVSSYEQRRVRRISQGGGFEDTMQLSSDPNSPCASASSPRMLRRSTTIGRATQSRPSLYHSLSDNSRPLDRQSYIQTDDFRLRRLTDSDAVMNLAYTASPGAKPLESVAWELGMRLDSHLDSHREATVSTPPLSPSSSPRDLHPTVKLRKLRSKGAPVYHDEARPITPSFPVMSTDKFRDPRSCRPVLRSVHAKTDRSSAHSPVSVLSRSSSRSDRGEQSRPRSHRCSEPGQQLIDMPEVRFTTRRATSFTYK